MSDINTKSTFQLIDSADGRRGPAFTCSSAQLRDSLVKSGAHLREDVLVLLVAVEGINEISRAPIINAIRFCEMVNNSPVAEVA